jgi:hypothetical protein
MASLNAEKESYRWQAAGAALFLVLCAISFTLILMYADSEVGRLGFLDLALLGLGTLRLIHLISFDKIFDFVRILVMDEKGRRYRKAERGWRRVICELMQCLWCAGLWSALVVVSMYLLSSWGRLATLVLAVAGLGSLLQIISKAIATEH